MVTHTQNNSSALVDELLVCLNILLGLCLKG